MPASNAQKTIMSALQAHRHIRARVHGASQSACVRSTSESSSPLDTLETIPWSVLGCCCWFSLEPGLPTQLECRAGYCYKINVIIILQALTGNHVGPTTAAASLEEMFSSGGGGGRGGTSKRVTVLLVDEMDLLVTKKQTV